MFVEADEAVPVPLALPDFEESVLESLLSDVEEVGVALLLVLLIVMAGEEAEEVPVRELEPDVLLEVPLEEPPPPGELLSEEETSVP